MESLIGLFIILPFSIWGSYRVVKLMFHLDEEKVEMKECTCGQEEKWCTSPVYYTSTRIRRNADELFACGKSKQDVENFKKKYPKEYGELSNSARVAGANRDLQKPPKAP